MGGSGAGPGTPSMAQAQPGAFPCMDRFTRHHARHSDGM